MRIQAIALAHDLLSVGEDASGVAFDDYLRSLCAAFGNSGGQIKVRFATGSHQSEACITVEDDGKGLELPPKKGLGLTLVEGFAQQIQGRIEYVPVETGCKIIFCFPVYMT